MDTEIVGRPLRGTEFEQLKTWVSEFALQSREKPLLLLMEGAFQVEFISYLIRQGDTRVQGKKGATEGTRITFLMINGVESITEEPEWVKRPDTSIEDCVVQFAGSNDHAILELKTIPNGSSSKGNPPYPGLAKDIQRAQSDGRVIALMAIEDDGWKKLANANVTPGPLTDSQYVGQLFEGNAATLSVGVDEWVKLTPKTELTGLELWALKSDVVFEDGIGPKCRIWILVRRTPELEYEEVLAQAEALDNGGYIDENDDFQPHY